MSKNCCTFAAEIGKGSIGTMPRTRIRQRRGATLKGRSGIKHIPQACGRREESLADFGLSSFRFQIGYETYIYSTLGIDL